MNEKKVCFITCVNDKEKYNEMLYYINNLEIPNGYSIECIGVENARSMTQGYNEAMKKTDAKYKVYLHQDTFIINKNFIYDILSLFDSNKDIGLIGIIGAKKMPTNAIWWDSKQKVGKVYESHTGKMDLLSFDEVQDDYCEVQAVDGLIMISQFDIPWRDDIFDGWHYYDASQCIEFIKTGYKVVVPKQEKPWIQHDCGIVNVNNGFEYYRNVFLDEYSSYIYPLVSVLIPTYNRPGYFKEALDSVLNQTYRNIKIIIGDDSTNNETEKLVKKEYFHKYSNIIYYHNEKNLGQFDNDIKLMNMAKGEYINFLMDDDLFAPQKIEKMMNYFIFDEKDEISLVTSHRAIIDEKGNVKNIFGNTNNIFKKDEIVDGIEIGNALIINHFNFIGEPTTVLFKKSKLKEPFGVFNGRKYGPNADQATWLNLLSEGKCVFINEILSYFRVHEGQQQNDNKLILQGYIDHAHKTLTCRGKGLLKEDKNYIVTQQNYLNILKDFIENYPYNKELYLNEYNELITYYSKLKESFENNFVNLINNVLMKNSENERKNILDNYVYDIKNDLFIKKDYTPIDYVDGSERYIINILNELINLNKNNIEDNLERYIKDWPTKYHLSKIRANIFEAIKDIIKDKNIVLELGGGMGAITEWLANHCENVDVIEGSLERATANKLRNKFNNNNNNVRVFVDNLLTMEFPKKNYDLVTLIGVLEYIPYYSNNKNADEICITFLNKIAQHLDEEGILVIAIENKIGAKYFTGCQEDHNGKLFSGLHDYPEKSPITFSRFEIMQILKKAGYKNIQFYDCFPDYKMPKIILQENDKIYDLNIASIARGMFPDYTNNRQYLICDPLLINTITKARLMHEFANSFLILCSKSENISLKTENLSVKFWNDNSFKNCFHHRINFVEEKGNINVKRTPLNKGMKRVETDKLIFSLNDENLIKGDNLSIEAYKCLIRKDNYKTLVELIKEVKDFINKEFNVNKLDSDGYNLLKGESIDCCFNNIIRDNQGNLNFIDRKWVYKGILPEDYILFRSLLGLFGEIMPYIRAKKFSEFVIPIMKNVYDKYDESRFEKNLNLETLFYSEIANTPIKISDISNNFYNKVLF